MVGGHIAFVCDLKTSLAAARHEATENEITARCYAQPRLRLTSLLSWTAAVVLFLVLSRHFLECQSVVLEICVALLAFFYSARQFFDRISGDVVLLHAFNAEEFNVSVLL